MALLIFCSEERGCGVMHKRERKESGGYMVTVRDRRRRVAREVIY